MKCHIYKCDDCHKTLSDNNFNVSGSQDRVAIPHIHSRGLMTIAYCKKESWNWGERKITKSEESQLCLECFEKRLLNVIDSLKENGIDIELPNIKT